MDYDKLEDDGKQIKIHFLYNGIYTYRPGMDLSYQLWEHGFPQDCAFFCDAEFAIKDRPPQFAVFRDGIFLRIQENLPEDLPLFTCHGERNVNINLETRVVKNRLRAPMEVD